MSNQSITNTPSQKYIIILLLFFLSNFIELFYAYKCIFFVHYFWGFCFDLILIIFNLVVPFSDFCESYLLA